MKTWIKRTLAVAIGATLLAGGVAACGHRPHHDRYFGPGATSVGSARHGSWVLPFASVRVEQAGNGSLRSRRTGCH